MVILGVHSLGFSQKKKKNLLHSDWLKQHRGLEANKLQSQPGGAAGFFLTLEAFGGGFHKPFCASAFFLLFFFSFLFNEEISLHAPISLF